MTGLTIGWLAKKADIGIETVRFYERQGLIAPPPPTQGDLVSIDTTDVANRDAIREGLSGLTAAQVNALMAALSPPQLLF